MNLAEILLIAFGLAMDAFAVCLGAGTTQHIKGPRPVFRLAFHFGLFQALMPILGWLVGSTINQWIAPFDHWIAFGLLSLVGGRMLREAGSEEVPESRADPTRGMTLVALSVATSIDALAAGLSLAFLHQSIWIPSVTTGVVTATMTGIGMVFGSRFGRRWGRWAEVIGGCVLILIGLRIVILDLTSSVPQPPDARISSSAQV